MRMISAIAFETAAITVGTIRVTIARKRVSPKVKAAKKIDPKNFPFPNFPARLSSRIQIKVTIEVDVAIIGQKGEYPTIRQITIKEMVKIRVQIIKKVDQEKC